MRSQPNKAELTRARSERLVTAAGTPCALHREKFPYTGGTLWIDCVGRHSLRLV